MYFDVPKLSANFSLLSKANQHCNAVSGSDYAFTDLLNVRPAAVLEAGVILSASGKIPGITRIPGTYTITDTTVATMATDCLSFDSAKLTFVTPTVPASATANGGAKKSRASIVFNSFAGKKLWDLVYVGLVVAIANLI